MNVFSINRKPKPFLYEQKKVKASKLEQKMNQFGLSHLSGFGGFGLQQSFPGTCNSLSGSCSNSFGGFGLSNISGSYPGLGANLFANYGGNYGFGGFSGFNQNF